MMRLLLLLPLALTGCGDLPGKPKPVANEGKPVREMSFAPLFAEHCAGCHGAEGNLGPAPPLNDPLFVKIATNDMLTMAISQGRPGTPMPAFLQSAGGALNDAQVKVLVEGIRSTWGTPAPSLNPPPYDGAKGDPESGKKLFATACAGCHGDEGKGGSVGPINNSAYLALSSDQVLRRYIITGRPDLGMPNFAGTDGRPKDFQPLSAKDVDDIAAYVISWKKK